MSLQFPLRRAAVGLLAALLLCACAKQPGNTPPVPPGTASAAPNAAPVAQYTRTALTAGGLAVEPGEAYYLPLGEGNYVPADDAVWQEYLDGQELEALEGLSMPFVGVARGEEALVYVMENPYRTRLRFSLAPALRVELVGESSALDATEDNNVRVYSVENSAAAVAAAYRGYVEETREILTLPQKAEQNPNIAKLYGAPQIYLWGEFLLSPQDVHWQALIQAADSPVLAHVSALLADTEDGSAFPETLRTVAGQDHVDSYQRSVLLRGFSAALTKEAFYDAAVLPLRNGTIDALLAKGLPTLQTTERIELHKQALSENLPGVFAPVAQWYDDETVTLLRDLKAAGLDAAWIGLPSWTQALYKPQLVETAVELGYLVGPYDSYHSIHEPGREQWETAQFPDLTLYESATVQNEQGEKISGFQGTGRKLNPTLAMPSVQNRVRGLLDTGIPFNSWFVDCDATGEVYDDYSPDHLTTKQQDVASRLERMEWIAEQGDLVVGSEGGNDFAVNQIAFAHGIELQSFSWMDEDMRANQESPYYLGKYYSATGGVPEKFAKPVPLKPRFRTLFADPAYQLPLYKLVYQDSVITSYHWDWSTLKLADETENRMLREILYNVPPMYHLDRTQWEANKEKITAHHLVWSAFSKQAAPHKMTAFEHLTPDRLVQSTRYGENLRAVANFSGAAYEYEGNVVPPRSVLLLGAGEPLIYTP